MNMESLTEKVGIPPVFMGLAHILYLKDYLKVLFCPY